LAFKIGGDILDMVALITGASSGIGREIALKLSRKDYYIINVSRREIPKEGGEPTHKLVDGEFYQLDLSELQLIPELVDYLRVYSPKLSVVVNNAGILPLTKTYSREKLEELFKVNTLVPYYLTQELIAEDCLNDGAVVIFISSISGIRGEPDDIAYGASKAALIAMAKGFAKAYPQYRFVAIAPGLVKTWLVGNPSEIPPELITKIPLGRVAEPEEIADLVAHIVDNKFINGTCLVIDGGEVG
jgi:NAD(P)-dependent dehydrogenase (short-subunit alcohol dehydrogenase family)